MKSITFLQNIITFELNFFKKSHDFYYSQKKNSTSYTETS